MITQVGSKENPVNRNTSKEILREYFDSWDERNPNLILIGAYLHGDEKGQIHLHSDYIPVAEYERGLSLRTGLNKALEGQGFIKRGKDTPQIQWQRSENNYLERLCRDRGIEVEHPERDKSPEAKREHEETRIYQANKDLDKREREQADKDREQRRTSRALEKKEKEITESRKTLDKDIEKVALDKDKVEALKEQIRADKAVIEQTRETAERIQNIRTDTLEIPEPQGKGIHKNYYTREQVEMLTKEVNKAREQARSIGQNREVESLDERLEKASRQASNNIKDKTIDKLQEENNRLRIYEKEHDYIEWVNSHYDMTDIRKEYEKEKKEHEKEHTHVRNKEREEPNR